MKKVLFATTALIATAGVAAADVTLKGSAQMGLIYQEAAATATNNEITVQTEVDLGVSMSTTTDGGLTVGADFNIAGDGGSNEDPTVFISGAFGKLSVGADVAEANRVAAMADIGFDGSNVDDVVEDLQELHGADVHYAYSVGGLGFAISADLASSAGVNAQTTTSSTTPWGVGVSYTMGTLKVAVGMEDADNAAGDDSRSLGVSYSMDALSLSVAMVEQTVSNVDTRGTGLSVGYKIDDANTITAAWADRDTALYDSSFGVQLTSNLGGGVTLNVGAASVYNATANDNRTNAQVGLAMSF